MSSYLCHVCLCARLGNPRLSCSNSLSRSWKLPLRQILILKLVYIGLPHPGANHSHLEMGNKGKSVRFFLVQEALFLLSQSERVSIIDKLQFKYGFSTNLVTSGSHREGRCGSLAHWLHPHLIELIHTWKYTNSFSTDATVSENSIKCVVH